MTKVDYAPPAGVATIPDGSITPSKFAVSDITWQGGHADSSYSGALSLAQPTLTQLKSGDMGILTVLGATGAPAGWTPMPDSIPNTYYKFYGASEGPISLSGTNGSGMVAAVDVYRGVSQATPFGAGDFASQSTGSTYNSGAAVAASANKDAVVSILAGYFAGSSNTVSKPTGFSTDTTIFSSNSVMIGFAHKLDLNSGESSGTPAWSGSVATNFCNVSTIILHSANANFLDQLNAQIASLTTQVSAAAPTLYNVKGFGALGDGVTDDTVAIQAAYSMAKLYGGVVYFPAGTYYCNHSGMTSVIAWARAHPGWVKFQGAGRKATVIKLSTNTPVFIGPSTGSGDYQYMGFEDITVDANNVTVAWGYQGVLMEQSDGSADTHDVLYQRFEIINMGASNDGPWRSGVDIGGYYGTRGGTSATRLIYNINIRDFIIGKVGGGGNYAIGIQGGGSVTDPSWDNESSLNQYQWPWYMDNITVENGQHYCGLQNETVYHACSNIIIGSGAHGGRVRVRNFYGNWSRDDGIEINSMLDVKIEDCQIENTLNAGIYFANLGGMTAADAHLQNLVVDNFYSKTAWVQLNNVNSYGAMGHLKVSNTVMPAFSATGRFKSVTLDNVILSTAANNGTTSNYNGQSLVTINHLGERATFTMNDVSLRSSSIQNGGTFVGIMINVDSINDLTLDLNNVRVSTDGSQTTNFQYHMLRFVNGQRINVQETFGTAGSFDNKWKFDSDAATSVARSGGVLTPTANLGTEKRLVALWHTDYFYAPMGPFTDGCISAQFAPGSTIAHCKGGVNYRVDGSNYIDAYVTDDGTNSYLCLDKVVAGTRTSLLGTVIGGAGTVTSISSPNSYEGAKGIQLASRIANGTQYSVRLLLRNSTVTADYWATSTRTGPATSGSNNTISATLTTADDALFGSQGQGFGGISWNPQDSAATVDNWYWDKMYVLRGSIQGLRLIMLKYPTTQFHGISYGYDSNYIRIDGSLDLARNNFAKGAVGTSVADYDTTDPVLLAATTAVQCKWAGTPSSRISSGVIATDYPNVQTLTGAYTLPSVGSYVQHDLTIAAATAITLPPAIVGATITVTTRQNSTGGYAVSFVGSKWPGGTPPTPSTGANRVDEYTFTCTNATEGWRGNAVGTNYS